MMVFLIAGLIALAVLLGLLRPLLRRDAAAPAAASFNTAVYRDQLAEIDRDRDRGALDDAEAAAARAEIGRRLLSETRAEGGAALTAVSGRAPRFAAIVLAAALPLAAGAVYLSIGKPELPAQPLAGRPPESLDPAAQLRENPQIQAMVERLATRLETEPNDPEGWALLARAYDALGQAVAAAKARTRLLEIAPDHPEGLWGLGLAAAEVGEADIARSYWTRLRDTLPEGADDRARVEESLARLNQRYPPSDPE